MQDQTTKVGTTSTRGDGGGSEGYSPVSSLSSSSSSSNPNPEPISKPRPTNPNPNLPNSMQSWWESISKARSQIQTLVSILPSSASSLSYLADSDCPARSLLDSAVAYEAVSSSLSGGGDDPLCHWLYDTFQSSDPDLCLVALSFLPLLSGLYLSRIFSASMADTTPSVAGFEAVLLSLYSAETKARAGKPILISVPDLSQPSLYHSPRNSSPQNSNSKPSVGVFCPPLEPQVAVKSTKRACIVGIALDCYYKKISFMPARSKIDLCEFAASWAGENCPCLYEIDNVGNCSDVKEEDKIENIAEGIEKLDIKEERSINCDNQKSRGTRIPLPWELLQPVLRILGHCLLAPLNPQEVRDAASIAIRCLYARASHDINPQAILATRSLIRLDKSARTAAKAAVLANTALNSNAPSKPKKPEVLLVSK